MPRTLVLLNQSDAVAVGISGTVELFTRRVDRHSALRFFFSFGGAGTGQIQLVWLLPDGTTTIQAAAEALTLVAGYLEVPVRAVMVTANVVEVGAADPITATGVVTGVSP